MAIHCRRPKIKWLLVLGSAICFFVADGCTYSFGIFYTEFVNTFGEYYPKNLISLVSGMLYGLPQISGPLVCPLIDALGPHRSCALGSILVSSSFVFGSLMQSFVGLLVIIGIAGSIGLEFLYATALTVVLTHFNRHRGLATGITVFGGGIGTLVFAQIYPVLEHDYLWRGTMMIESGIFLHTAIAACLYFMFVPVPGKEDETLGTRDEMEPMRQLKSLRDAADAGDDQDDEKSLEEAWAVRQATSEVSFEERLALTGTLSQQPGNVSQGLVLNLASISNPNIYEVDPPSKCDCSYFGALQESFKAMSDSNLWSVQFTLYCIINLVIAMFIIQPWMFIHDYGVRLNIESSHHIISVMGITYSIGQITFGALADFLNAYILYGICLALSGISCLLMGIDATFYSLIFFGAVFGAVMGGTMALYSLLLLDMVGKDRLLTSFGVFLPFVGLGNLAGVPISASLATSVSYASMFIIGGTALLVLSLIYLPLAIRPARVYGIKSIPSNS